jgi:hypothetical protein
VLELDLRHVGAVYALALSLDAQGKDSLEAWAAAADLYLSTSKESPFLQQALSRALELTRARGLDERAAHYAGELKRWLAEHPGP